MATEQGEPVRDATAWLEQTRVHATVLSEAHRLRLTRRLWWANFFLVVIPAVLSTAAAIFAARPPKQGDFTILSLLLERLTAKIVYRFLRDLAV